MYDIHVELPERDPKFVLDLRAYESKDALIKAVENLDHEFSEYALSIIGHDDWQLLTKGGKYGFWEYEVGELTGKKEVKTPVLYEAIHHHQFIDAPHQSAIDTLIANKGQTMYVWLPILSTPIPDSDGDLAVLIVEHNYRFNADRVYVWQGSDRVLVCRKLD